MEANNTWAIVLATFAGPVAAVGISLWREGRRERRQLRFAVFRVLMANRRTAISLAHVEAINTVEVAFHGVEPVEAAHATYLAHLNDRLPENATQTIQQAWEDKRQDLLAVLLSKIANSLKVTKDQIDIRSGGYAPDGWRVRDERDLELRAAALEVLKGDKPLRVTAEAAPTVPPKGKSK
jgi:hypothetical protein